MFQFLFRVAIPWVAMSCPVALFAQTPDSAGSATFGDSGLIVRFPRSMSPDSITREMPVMDLFSGYEWRVALLGGNQGMLAALVLPPNDSLRLHHVATIRDLYMTGDLRQCQMNVVVLACERPARGLVRDVAGSIEIGIVDPRWMLFALSSARPTVRLIVERAREILWMRDIPIVAHIP